MGKLTVGAFRGHGGIPNSWMVSVREDLIRMDDDWGYPHDETETSWKIAIWLCLKLGDTEAKNLELVVLCFERENEDSSMDFELHDFQTNPFE